MDLKNRSDSRNGITYFEKPIRDKNIDDCQQTDVIFHFQEDTEASLYGDFKKIITYVKFVPCIIIMHCVLLFE